MFRYGEMHDKKPAMKTTPRIGRMKPFKLFANVYYVGTYQACCHLIDTGDGLIMIDPGYASTAYLVIDGIYRLGFKPEDIKYIINTHWHWDHTEASADFADLFGAKNIIGREDAEKAKQFFTPDILVDDGDELKLGNTVIKFMHTPGHTKGTISLFFDVTEDGKTYRVGTFGGAGANTLFRGKFDFENPREAYFNSLKRLKGEQVDVFIGNHSWNNGTYEKSIKLFETGENDFLDPTLWGKFLDACEKRLIRLIEEEKGN